MNILNHSNNYLIKTGVNPNDNIKSYSPFYKDSLFFYIFGMADYTSHNLIISTLLKKD